jgi:hypothetical protein
LSNFSVKLRLLSGEKAKIVGQVGGIGFAGIFRQTGKNRLELGRQILLNGSRGSANTSGSGTKDIRIKVVLSFASGVKFSEDSCHSHSHN